MKHDKHHILMLMVFIASSGFFAAGYGIMSLIFRLTGTPPSLWTHVLSGLIGMLLIVSIASVFRIVAERHGISGIRQHKDAHNQLLSAMTRIAQGDFNVFINMRDDFFHGDIVQGINKIARDLGSMEQLRQNFISNVSHEIQSPLTSISGFTALLKDDKLTDDQKNHYLDIIAAESKRLSSLSDNLLKLSALETGNETLSIKEYRLDRQLEKVVLMLEPQWRTKNIIMEADLERLTAKGDEDLLSQVWVNLLHNAIKFTPDSGVIRVILKADNNQVYCHISDTGIGIAPEDQVHIFERFYKVDKSRDRALGGNGLGLSLVKKIVELHGGHITPQSELGKGTTFNVTLPRLHSV